MSRKPGRYRITTLAPFGLTIMEEPAARRFARASGANRYAIMRGMLEKDANPPLGDGGDATARELLAKAMERPRALSTRELATLLRTPDPKPLFEAALSLRRSVVGGGVALRGLVEISNICEKNCYYCYQIKEMSWCPIRE